MVARWEGALAFAFFIFKGRGLDLSRAFLITGTVETVPFMKLFVFIYVLENVKDKLFQKTMCIYVFWCGLVCGYFLLCFF